MNTHTATEQKLNNSLLLKQEILEHVPLQDKTWFQTGGPARYFTEPTTISQFSQVLRLAHEQAWEIFVLGKGANILVHDNGFPGLVIRPKLLDIEQKQLDQETVLVTAGAGVCMQKLIDYCLNNNIIGLEEFSGIPATVGGAVYINLHYVTHFIADFLQHAQVLEKATGTVHTVDTNWFGFGYDQSTLQNKPYYLATASFKLKQVDPISAAYAKGRRDEIIRHRNMRYPSTHTCGSFFRNFYPEEVSLFVEGTNKKLIYSAYYLDNIGTRGSLRVGGAAVSHQHANMIVNTGTATSEDIINVAHIMQERVHEKFGLLLQPECQLIGFPNYPLLSTKQQKK